ncbi:hypothetical protein AB0K18_49555 [Nonomuraea sp. NPDC049421]|uniref:hypothetical protein n=1 Tax=Nonomuraea sp. NPDC049421 TaxID=3155275 RepID=UPI0034239D1A
MTTSASCGGLSKVMSAVTAVCLALVTAGCAAFFLPEELKVDPAAVEEVHDIGTVFTRTMADPIYGNTIQLEDILIMDVGGSGVDEALDIARERLAQRGWKVVGASERLLVMESAKWEGTTLQAAGVDRFESYGAERETEILKELETDPAKADKYLVVSLSPAK